MPARRCCSTSASIPGRWFPAGLGAGSAKSYSVTGDTVNTAQRLQSLAAPGEVLVGPLTHRLTRHAFAFESLGEIALRGKTGSMLVHRLVGPLEQPRAVRGLEALGLSAPLIGRDAELERMLASLDLACGGSAQLVRLVGEAGIGKSRLVSEFIARIGDEERFHDVAVRQTACSPLGEQSYGAIGAVVRSAAGSCRNAAPSEMRAKLADLLADLGLDDEEAARLTPLLFHVIGLGDPDGDPAARRTRATAAADSLCGSHDHRAATGVVAAAHRRRGSALGRHSVARGPAIRDGPARTGATDARGDAPANIRGRSSRLQPGQPHHAQIVAPQLRPKGAAC